MLEASQAFSGFSVKNLEAAKEFYGTTLGLDVEENDQGLELHLRGGTNVFLYPKSDHRPATFTVLNFPVGDLEKTVDELAKKGVEFEHYSKKDIATDKKGIHHAAGMDIAWFHDPDGNIISLIQRQMR